MTQILSNFTSGPAYSNGVTDLDLELAATETLVSTTSVGMIFGGLSSQFELTIFGVVRGSSSSSFSGIDVAGGSSTTIELKQGGIVSGGRGITTVATTDIYNSGAIVGMSAWGVALSGSGTQNVTNNDSGLISGATVGIRVSSNGTHTIINDGLIDAPIAIDVDNSSSIELITNTGTINGGMELNGGADIVDSIGGQIMGTVNLGAGFNEFFGGHNNDHAIGGADSDLLDGGLGNDTLEGGAGDDNYYVDSQGDIIVEAAGDALDTVLARASYTLAADVDIEKLQALGSANLDLGGNGIANQLYGNSGNNIITSTDIGDGADDLRGALGDDTYVMGDVADTINDTGGNDTIQTVLNLSLQNYTGVDNIQLTGSANVGATGNGGANRVTGNSGKNLLEGGGGNDILVGGLGADSLLGGNERDTFDFNTLTESGLNAARDTIFDFASGSDRIDLATIDAITGGLDSAFLLDARGTAGSSVAKGHIGYFWINKDGVSNDRTVLRMNVDGDATIEMSIALQGLHTMKAGDFAL